MSVLRASLVPFLLLAGLLLSCTSPEPPYIRVIEPLALPDAPRIYLISNRNSQRMVESLNTNGLLIAKGISKANLLLRVNFGAKRKQTAECGQVRNLKYELRRANRLVLWIQGRGPTGKCADNIVDQMTAELARLLGS